MRLLTHSVRQNLQPDHTLVAVQLQAVDAIEAIVFDQVEGRVHRDLVQDRPLPLGRLT